MKEPNSETGKQNNFPNDSFYKNLFEEANFPLTLADEDGRIIMLNKAAAYYWNKPREEVLGLTFSEILPPEKYDGIKKLIRNVIETGETRRRIDEVELLGERRWFRSSISPIIDEAAGLKAVLFAAGDITGEVLREKAEKEAEDKYRAIFELAGDGILIVNPPEGEIHDVNQTFSNLTGYTKSQVLGKKLRDLVPRRLRGRGKAICDNMPKDGEIISIDTVWEKKDGSEIHVALSSREVELEGYKYCIVIAKDFTEKKIREQELLRSRKNFDSLFRGIPVPTYVWKREEEDFVLLDHNTAAKETTKDEIGKYLGVKLSEYAKSHPRVVEEVHNCYLRRTNILKEVEFLPTENLPRRYFDVRYVFIEPDLVMVHAEDITTKKTAVKKLQESEERLSYIANNLPGFVYQVIMTKHREVKYTYISEGCYAIYGYTPEKIKEDSSYLLNGVHPDDKAVMDDMVERSFNELVPYNCEHRVIKPNGDVLWIRAEANPVRFKDGTVMWAGVAMDVTETKELEENLTYSRMRYKLLFEKASDAIIVVRDSRITDANHRACEIMGRTKKDLLGQHPGELSPKYQSSGQASMEKAEEIIQNVKVGENKQFEWRHIKGNGEPVETEVIMTKTDQLEEGETILAYLRDITGRKKIEERLKVSEDRYKTFIRNTSDMVNCWEFSVPISIKAPVSVQIKAIGEQAVLVECNDAFAKGYGLDSRFDIIGKTMFDLVESDQGNVLEMFGEFVENGYRIEGFESEEHIKLAGVKYFSNNAHGVVVDEKLIRIWVSIKDITKQKLVERELKKQEETLRIIFNASPIAMMIIDKDFKTTAANDVIKKIFDVDEKNLVGAQPCDGLNCIVTEDNLEKCGYSEICKSCGFRSAVTQVFESGKGISNLETKATFLISGKASEYWIMLNAEPVVLNGEMHVVVAFNDVTRRKQNEMALAERNAFIQTVLDKLPIGVAINETGKGTATYLNKKFEEIYGWPKEDLKNVEEFFEKVYPDKEYRAKLYKEVFDGIASDNPDKMIWDNLVATGKDGTERIIKAVNIPLPEQEVMVSTVMDLTQQKKAEIAVRESEQKYRSIFENSPLAILRCDLDGEILSVNDAIAKLLGYKPEELIGMNYKDITYEDDVEISIRLYEGLVRGEYDYYQNQKRYLHKNGTPIWTSLTVSGECGEDGKVKYVLGLIEDISEKVKSEQILKESETRYRAIFENSVVPIAVSLHGKLITCNSAFCTMYRYTMDELTGIMISELVLEEEREKIMHYSLNRENDNDIPNIYDMTALRKDGTTFTAEVSVNLYQLENEVYNLSIIRDVTSVRKAEQKIKESEKKFRKVLEDMQLIGIMLDNDGKITFCNDFLLRLSGYKREEVLNKDWFEIFIPEDDREELKKLFVDTIRRDKMPVYNQGEIVTKQGKRKQINWSNTLMFDLNDNVIGITSIGEDITDKLNTLNELKESEERYRSIFNNNHSVMLIFDPETIEIKDANPAAQNFYGYSHAEFKNMKITKLNRIEEERLIKKVSKAKNKEKNVFSLQHKLKNGEVKDVTVHSGPILLEGRTYLYSIVHDETERRRIEGELDAHRRELEQLVQLRTKELEETNKQLEEEIIKQKKNEKKVKKALDKEIELNQLKTRFISTASHEFRTPLTGVLTSTELLEKYGKKLSEDKYSELINRIKQSVEYLTSLMDDVLTISRTDTGKIRYEPGETNLVNLCNELVSEAKSSASAGHEIIFDYKSEVNMATVDSKLIRFILTNLLNNAIKFSPSGGLIEFTVSNKDNFIIFKIKDTGIGIVEEDVKNLFEPFNRGTNVGDIQGTGLGLSIVRRSVDIHGGEIEITGEENKGTTVTVSIPMDKK